MARTPNPALLGGFVLGAGLLAVAGLVVFGGGKLFRSTQPWVAYFDESIKGLTVGAPVTFRGVRVGTVTDIRVVLDQKEEVRTPVIFELEANRITTAQGGDIRFSQGGTRARRLFERGLRARLELQSFATGQLGINLDFFPNSPMRLVGKAEKHIECPTIPSAMSALGRGLEELNSAELAKNVQDILQGMARLVNRPELEAAVVSASTALKNLDHLVLNADARVTALGSLLDTTSTTANDTLMAIEALARRVDGQTVPAVNETLGDAQRLVRRVDAETVPAVGQVLAELQPLVGDVIRTAGAARGALERAEATLNSVDGLLEERSSLRYQLRVTLQELAAAARAFRTLSSYLERRPEAVLFGKAGRGGGGDE
jgi:paraquat-inducible protein B